jgi:hypothetical protein
MPASGVSSQVSRHPSLVQEATEVHIATASGQGSRLVADLEGEFDALQWLSHGNQNNFDQYSHLCIHKPWAASVDAQGLV